MAHTDTSTPSEVTADRSSQHTPAAIDAGTLARAESGDRAAIERVLREVHPGVHRTAHALVGDADRAAGVVRFVFATALRVLPQWSTRADPETWFMHQAVQAARRAAHGRPPGDQDLLLTALPAEARSPGYAAFVRAVRRLPPQQAEAYVLHHGERLNARFLGVAMDCSTQAAETHLRAAAAAVRQLAGDDDLPRFAALLYQACRSLVPPPALSEQFVRGYVRAWSGARTRRRLGRLVVTLGVLAAVAAAGWQYRDIVRQQIGRFQQPASQPETR